MDRPTDAATTVLSTAGAELELSFADHGTVVARLDADPTGAGARAAARLMCDAIRLARGRRQRCVRTVLELARPVSGIVLEAVRARIGEDAEDVHLRRAGSSVMVTVALVP